MVNKCCVPKCTANYDSKKDSGFVTCFGFPAKSDLKEKWIRKIPRENLLVTKHTVVCIKHFKESDIIRNDILPGKNGGPDVVIPRKRLKLKSDAVPSIFPNLPSYLSDNKVSTVRASPSTRKRRYEDYENSRQEAWINRDTISSYKDFEKKAGNWTKQYEGIGLIMQLQEKCTLFYTLSKFDSTNGDDLCPSLRYCIKVASNLKISVWKNGFKMISSDLSWLNLQLGVLSYWSQLENLLSHLNRCDEPVSDDFLIQNAITLLKKTSCEENCGIKKFILQQLELLNVKPKQRRFSADLLITAMSLHCRSPNVYNHLRNTVLILPSARQLRKLSGSLTQNFEDSDQYVYLKNKAKKLQDKQLYVNLLLDEMHVKPLLTYKNGKMIGSTDKDIATTIHCFMISSIFSSNKDVVKFVPAKKIPAEQLLKHLKNVLITIRQAGYVIVSIITDGNRINKKLFKLLSEVQSNGDLPSYVSDPVDPSNKIFLLFDSVHILKCIRNNWINLKNYKKTFTFPDLDNFQNLMRASFAELETIYNVEMSMVLKKAPQLTWKALHPHSLERQNVKLALRIFNDTNCAALICYGPVEDNLENWKGTSLFIATIWKWWNIVNVDHPYKGRNTRNPDAEPFSSVDDARFDFMQKLIDWLDNWAHCDKQSKEGFLTADTYFSLKHTIKSLAELIKHLLSTLKIDFILTGKFQTDDLESRFGQYRQMCGGNRLVSVQEIIESEKKLKIKSVLKLYPADEEIPVKDYLFEFSNDSQLDKSSFLCFADQQFVETFPYPDVSFKNENLPVLVYVAGYIASKVTSKVKCVSCSTFLSHGKNIIEAEIDCSINDYFKNLNRGGLTYPSSKLLHVLQALYSIFNSCISNELNQHFLNLKNQKTTLLSLNSAFWDISDDLEINAFVVCPATSCSRTEVDVFKMCVNIFSNILLNNYTKSRNDKLTYAVSLSTKLSKFPKI